MGRLRGGHIFGLGVALKRVLVHEVKRLRLFHPLLLVRGCGGGLASMPLPLPWEVRWNLSARTVPPSSAFPGFKAGQPLHQSFRGLPDVYSVTAPNSVSPMRPLLHRRLQQLRLRPCCFGCYWTERTSSPGEACNRCGPAPFHGGLEPVAYLNDSYRPSGCRPLGRCSSR